MRTRRVTKPLYVGDVKIGGDAPISVQSMTKTDTRDVAATVRQIREMEEAGCEIVRSAVPDMEAAKALKNITRLTKKALFFGALTKEDWKLCDKDRTDPEVYLRGSNWYRKRLGPHFLPVGGGLFLKKPTEAVIWTLDHL